MMFVFFHNCTRSSGEVCEVYNLYMTSSGVLVLSDGSSKCHDSLRLVRIIVGPIGALSEEEKKKKYEEISL